MMAVFTRLSSNTAALKLRILVPGLMTLAVLIYAVYLENYRIYHAVEIALLLVWLGSLNVFSFRTSAFISLLAMSGFSGVAYLTGATELKLTGLLAMLVAAFTLALSLSYMLERFRRNLFLTSQTLVEVFNRQESWAYTLIDLDILLSGIFEFKDLISRLMEHMKTVIDYDSFVLTVLEGKGPKPKADLVDGTLFEQEDKTIWSEDLLTKLAQTRHATVSDQYELQKGFLGRQKKKFLHFRIDIPVFNDSSMVAVISLRRKSAPFDDLDLVASVSLASQSMLIFKRTEKLFMLSTGLHRKVDLEPVPKTPVKAAPKPSVQSKVAPPAKAPAKAPIIVKESSSPEVAKESSSPSTNIDFTAEQSTLDSVVSKPREVENLVVPSDVVKKMRQETVATKKTITLLSRENAEHVAMDRYRTAAIEGEHLSLLLVEVDGLSSIREKDGDQAAYKVFAGIVKYVFSKTDSESDVLGRYGQNGFSILLPRVDMNMAEKFAEALRQYAESAIFKTPYGERKATLSIGVAAITDETGNHESMVRRADMALFVAKKNGRNCVKVRL